MKAPGIESKREKKLSRFLFHLNFVLVYLFLGHPSVSEGNGRHSKAEVRQRSLPPLLEKPVAAVETVACR